MPRYPRFLPGAGASAPAPTPPNPDLSQGTTTGAPGNTFFPSGSPFPGSSVWATYLTSAGGDRPLWILSDLTTSLWVAPNVATGDQGDPGNPATLKAWSIAVPANAIGYRIAATAGSSAALTLWRMNATSTAGQDLSAQGSPFAYNPIARGQNYVMAACIGQNPRMSAIAAANLGLVIGGASVILGAAANTPGQSFAQTFRVDAGHQLGFYQWYTDTTPPIL